MPTTARSRVATVPVRLAALPAFPFDLLIALALIGLADLTWAQRGGLTALHLVTVAASLLPLSLRRRRLRALPTRRPRVFSAACAPLRRGVAQPLPVARAAWSSTFESVRSSAEQPGYRGVRPPLGARRP